MKVWAYVTVWNEEKMLPYYLRHYSTFCERIIVLDNQSTDNTLRICKQYPIVEVREYNTNETFNDYVHLDLKHQCINDAKGNADYIIVSDCDEFIVHPNILEWLENNDNAVIFPAGFQMVSQSFPIEDNQIYDEIKYGVPDPWYSKPILINPNKVDSFEWIEGCHEIDLNSKIHGEIYHPVPSNIRPIGEWNGHPWGRWKMQFEILNSFNDFPIKLLHYKFMGKDYVEGRYRQYAIRNSEANIKAKLAIHYETSLQNNSIQNEIDELELKAIKVDC
jgi:glycosyltransferase involved in cell wall biosynthesis